MIILNCDLYLNNKGNVMKCTCCDKKIWFWQKSFWIKGNVFVHAKCFADPLLARKINPYF